MKRLSFWLFSLFALFLMQGCAPIDWVGGLLSGMVVGILAILGLWYVFWPFVFAGFTFVSWMIEEKDENPFWVFISIAIYLAIIKVVTNADFISFVKDNTLYFLLCVIPYFALGLWWARFRLKSVGKEAEAKYLRDKEEYLSSGGTEEAWLKRIKDLSRHSNNKLTIEKMKGRLLSWICYWPGSLFWFLLHDFLRELKDFIFDLVKNYYRKVFEKALGKMYEDYAEAEKNK